MTYDEWAAFGLAQGWVGPAVCVVEDGIPTSSEEDEEAEATGEYPCHHVLRLYVDLEQKVSVEANHAPSIWRQPR
jgi:hypothetical protein